MLEKMGKQVLTWSALMPWPMITSTSIFHVFCKLMANNILRRHLRMKWKDLPGKISNYHLWERENI